MATTTLERRDLLLGLSAVTLALALCYWQILFLMGKDWWIDSNYSHGFLIPLVTGYLIWQRQDRLDVAAVRPASWGLLVVVAGLLLLVVGRAGSELFTMRVSFLVVLAGLVISLLGTDITRKIAFPMSYLIFMVPLPYILYDAVAFPLKLVAARFATSVVSLLGIPIFREGNIIHLPHTTLEVADACSGIRSLMSLLALGVIFAYLTQNRVWKQVLLVLLTVPIAVFANSFRVTGTAVLSHYYGPSVAEGFFHDFSGWVVFVVAFGLLFLCGSLLRSLPIPRKGSKGEV